VSIRGEPAFPGASYSAPVTDKSGNSAILLHSQNRHTSYTFIHSFHGETHKVQTQTLSLRRIWQCYRRRPSPSPAKARCGSRSPTDAACSSACLASPPKSHHRRGGRICCLRRTRSGGGTGGGRQWGTGKPLFVASTTAAVTTPRGTAPSATIRSATRSTSTTEPLPKTTVTATKASPSASPRFRRRRNLSRIRARCTRHRFRNSRNEAALTCAEAGKRRVVHS